MESEEEKADPVTRVKERIKAAIVELATRSSG